MGSFTRVSGLMKADINDLIDRAQDPEKMVKQIILDMQKELAKSAAVLRKATESERMVKKQMDDAALKSLGHENKAKTALLAGDMDSAKIELAGKIKADTDTQSFMQMQETISAQIEVIRDQAEVLNAKLEEAKTRRDMLIENLQTTEAPNSIDVSDKIEEKITQKEKQFPYINADIEFEHIESDIKIDAELNRLMAELGMSPALTHS